MVVYHVTIVAIGHYLIFRLGTDEEEEEEEEKPEDKKKIWKADAAPKWGHDKFLELDQNPKSK